MLRNVPWDRLPELREAYGLWPHCTWQHSDALTGMARRWMGDGDGGDGGDWQRLGVGDGYL